MFRKPISPGAQAVRYKRTLAYPRYKPQHNTEKSHPKKDHSSSFARALKGFLGPKNVRGEYYRNRYYYPNQDHSTNYIVVDGQTVVDLTYSPTLKDKNLRPFPQNPGCQTSLMISDELKAKIIEDVASGLHYQEVAHKHGLFMLRVEAICRLHTIEQDWKQQVSNDETEKNIRLVFKTKPWLETLNSDTNILEQGHQAFDQFRFHHVQDVPVVPTSH